MKEETHFVGSFQSRMDLVSAVQTPASGQSGHACVHAGVFMGGVDACGHAEGNAASPGLPYDLCRLWERG